MALLSDRLKAVAEMITPGIPVADIGCDHAYLPIHLVKEGISPHVIACDINKGPVLRARENVKEVQLEDKIEVRQGNGLLAIEPGEAECVVLAGMGGPLMEDILTAGEEVLGRVSEIILEPQSDNQSCAGDHGLGSRDIFQVRKDPSSGGKPRASRVFAP